MSRTTTADSSLITDIEAFEERAAIAEYDGGLTRQDAEDLAAEAQGFQDREHYWAWLRVYFEKKRLE